MKKECTEKLQKDISGVDKIQIKEQIMLARLKGQESTLEVDLDSVLSLYEAFKNSYEEVYSHWIEDRTIEVVSVKVVAETTSNEQVEPLDSLPRTSEIKRIESYLNGEWKSIGIIKSNEFYSGLKIEGPCIILSKTGTAFVPLDWCGKVGTYGDLLMHRSDTEDH